MIKSELIKTIAQQMTHLPVQTVDAGVNLILRCMSEALENGQRIDIRNFGAFTVRAMPARLAHNPKSGKKMTAAPSVKIHFKPGIGLKERVKASRELVAIEE